MRHGNISAEGSPLRGRAASCRDAGVLHGRQHGADHRGDESKSGADESLSAIRSSSRRALALQRVPLALLLDLALVAQSLDDAVALLGRDAEFLRDLTHRGTGLFRQRLPGMR